MSVTPPAPYPESKRRRSQRAMLSLPITASGETAEGAFCEDTRTIVVNAHGALITLATKVGVGQVLRIKNSTHMAEQSCRVTYMGPSVDGRTQVGIEFIEPAAQFWRIAFPPDDWVPVG